MTAQDDLISLARLNEQITRLKAEKDAIQAMVVEAMKEAGQKTMSASGVHGTLVESTVVEIDADRLKGELSAPMWKRVTKTVLDKEKLEAHVATGDIDPNVVASCSEEKPRAPYIRLSGHLELPETPPATAVRKARPRKRSQSAPAKAVS